MSTFEIGTNSAEPLVSIVTPSYNQSEYIEDTIQSVANQRYPAIEHVVVDGKSDDGTVEILQQYEDQIRWVSEPDEGQADAINKGFDMANGDIVGWLNSDDVFFVTSVINRVVEYFDTLKTDVIYGDMALLNADSEVLKLQVTPRFDYEKLLLGCFIEQPSLFFDRAVLEDERLDTDLQVAIDYEFWLRLARENEFRHVPDVLAGDRNHEQRKILAQRDALVKESERVRSKYGGPTGSERERQRKLKLLTSGVPRAGRAALRTVSLHSSDPQLAFDGELLSLHQMLRNTARLNRNLV